LSEVRAVSVAVDVDAAGVEPGTRGARHHVLAVVRQLVSNPLGAIGLSVLAVMALVAVFAPAIAPYPSGYGNLEEMSLPPSSRHPFGTDDMGLDILAQVVWGTRVSMLVGIAATMLSLAIGVPIGLLSGFYRGRVDALTTSVVDLFLSLPVLPLMILLGAVLGPSLTNVILVIGFFCWPSTARVVRAQALSIAEQQFTEAARAMGATDARILLKHLLPNVFPPIMVNMVLTIATAVLSEAGLSFLGLGDPTQWSWGRILENAHRSGAFVTAWWHTLFPSIAIMLLVMSANFLGMAINEILNPRLKRR
jgi:peptide/nickel transport system permease protein